MQRTRAQHLAWVAVAAILVASSGLARVSTAAAQDTPPAQDTSAAEGTPQAQNTPATQGGPPTACRWRGTATAAPQSPASAQALIRLTVDQDLGNPSAVHSGEETVQFNYAYGSSFLSGLNIRANTALQVSGYIRGGGQCVADTLNVGTLEPGYEGYIQPGGACLTAGSETISVAEKASRPLGCAVGPQIGLTTPIQPFQNGRMLYSRGIYVLQRGTASPTGGTWSGVRDTWRAPEPEQAGLNPPNGMFEPRRGFGKAWRDIYGGPTGSLGWGIEDEHSERANWQQFENGIVIVTQAGVGYVLYYDGRSWEQLNR
jgi:hypothetical protein